jgi:hypothetical protein
VSATKYNWRNAVTVLTTVAIVTIGKRLIVGLAITEIVGKIVITVMTETKVTTATEF